MQTFQIRKYRRNDEGSIRRICFDTALYGEPIAEYFNDIQLVTDALIGCNIWLEPESLFVAEAQDRVVGYLAGSIDTERFAERCAPRLVPRLLWRFITRGHFLKSRNYALALGIFKYSRIIVREREALLNDYPCSIHTNIDSGYRNAGIGTALIRKFIEYAKSKGSKGVHLSTASSSVKDFFLKTGFHIAATSVSPRIFGKQPREMWLLAMSLSHS